MNDPQGYPAVSLGPDMLDRLMPMHLLVSSSGHVLHAGPTLVKLAADRPPVGRRFLEIFELRRPRRATGIAELIRPGGMDLLLRFRGGRRTALKGLAVPLDDGSGLLVNLSLGISAVDAVGQYDLTAADFPPTDLTVELLYLVEAKKAVLTETRNLNRRLEGAKIAAEEQAFTDTLTGLKNRRAMDRLLQRFIAAGVPFGMMHLDLDYFKEVNDTHGHAAGDHVLQVVARILLDETRQGDAAVRAGGDEFVLIFPQLTRHDRLAAAGQRILGRLNAPIAFDGAECNVSGSIGVVTTEDVGTPQLEDMLRDADRALYSSKRAGRARLTFAHPEPGDAGPRGKGPLRAGPGKGGGTPPDAGTAGNGHSMPGPSEDAGAKTSPDRAPNTGQGTGTASGGGAFAAP